MSLKIHRFRDHFDIPCVKVLWYIIKYSSTKFYYSFIYASIFKMSNFSLNSERCSLLMVSFLVLMFMCMPQWQLNLNYWWVSCFSSMLLVCTLTQHCCINKYVWRIRFNDNFWCVNSNLISHTVFKRSIWRIVKILKYLAWITYVLIHVSTNFSYNLSESESLSLM